MTKNLEKSFVTKTYIFKRQALEAYRTGVVLLFEKADFASHVGGISSYMGLTSCISMESLFQFYNKL